MNRDQLKAVKLELTERLKSLENDFQRAYINIPENPEIAPSPFPIVMYTMAALDLFSSLWSGWSDSKHRGSDTRSQTERMIDFLSAFTNYPTGKSKILVQMYRHKLMHTSEARQLLDPSTGNIYLMSISPSLKPKAYLEIDKVGKYNWLHLGVENFINDLKKAIFDKNMYYDQLKKDPKLQSNFIRCWTELNSYTL
ncbi:hypothetical protein HYW46_00125 [Candidatus Daviesbacteria bacterium]|nr:hypothetical protein [Candidatus Daviesbacteria bacterium]